MVTESQDGHGLEHAGGADPDTQLGRYLSLFLYLEQAVASVLQHYIDAPEGGPSDVAFILVEDAGMPFRSHALRLLIEREELQDEFGDLPGMVDTANAERNWMVHSQRWSEAGAEGAWVHASVRQGRIRTRELTYSEAIAHVQATIQATMHLLSLFAEMQGEHEDLR